MNNPIILASSSGQNLALAHRYADAAKSLGLNPAVIELAALHLPLYCAQLEAMGPGPTFQEFSESMQRAQAFVVCAPEYNGSMPPVLINAITWLSRSTDDFRAIFNGKPIALATHSGGGGQKVLLGMRVLFSHLGCTVIGRDMLATKNKPPRHATMMAQLEGLARLT
ncbi:MAG: NAD(P)H-dependent oxidoreductase [Myxococcota bacterium]|nr:NAD(P)H-dependent oxidoreductase [Myxococcota bacterium]